MRIGLERFSALGRSALGAFSRGGGSSLLALDIGSSCVKLVETDGWFYGRGTGDDGPLLVPSPNRSEELLDLRIEEECSFVVKPYVAIDGIQDYCRFGDSVVVTGQGTERLGTRAKKLIEKT